MRTWDETRRAVLWQAHTLSGRKEWDRMAWWVTALWCLLRPISVVELLAARVINPMAPNCYRIGGMRFTHLFFHALCNAPEPTPWFRIIKREDGLITIERKADD